MVIITYHTNVLMKRCQHTHKLVLSVVGILILVNHYVFKFVSVVFQYICIFFKQHYSVVDYIVKIHCICRF